GLCLYLWGGDGGGGGGGGEGGWGGPLPFPHPPDLPPSPSSPPPEQGIPFHVRDERIELGARVVQGAGDGGVLPDAGERAVGVLERGRDRGEMDVQGIGAAAEPEERGTDRGGGTGALDHPIEPFGQFGGLRRGVAERACERAVVQECVAGIRVEIE